MKAHPKVAFHTLGCKLNFSETSTIAKSFRDGGYTNVKFDEQADIYVINTCSVTENANRKCRKVIRQALRNNPEAFVAVAGCFAQLQHHKIARIPGVDLVLGSSEKYNILDHINGLDKVVVGNVHVSEIKDKKHFVPGYSMGDRTRSFLKIQDGCDYHCSFCTIPLARGTSRSNRIEQTLESAMEIALTEVKEVVLTGVNIGDFGKTTGETFLELIKELEKIDGIERFRISSVEPDLLSDEIIRFVAESDKFAPHFHLPLQSGSDKTLKLMRRRYNKELYANRITSIKQMIPDCCIGVDVIVGFPSESEKDFLETYNFINNLDISYLHVFTYSERENTVALQIKESVPTQERGRRSQTLRNLSEKKRRHFYENSLGKFAKVLFEAKKQGKTMHGFTENYIKVKYPYDHLLVNKLQEVHLISIDKDGVMEVETTNEQ